MADIFDPERKEQFGRPVTGLSWIDENHYHRPDTDPRTRLTEHRRVEALTGAAEPLFEAGRLESALRRLPHLTGEEARRLARQASYVMNGRRTALLVSALDDLFLYDFAAGTLTRLTRAQGAEEEPSFSPDGRRVAFVRGNDLHVVDVTGGGERALTRDGSADVLNGILDWVYQEEIYGRGHFRAYWWSPDSRHLALLQLRQSRVPTLTLVDDLPRRPQVETQRYPRPGDPNPEVRLGVVSAAGGGPRWIDLSRYAAAEPLVVGVGWSPDGARVVYQVQDRVQTWLDVNVALLSSLGTRTLFRETTRAWVEPHEEGKGLRWLPDGGFLWLSERSGFKHVYHYRGDGTLVRPVTGGQWEVRALHGADGRGWVYFSGTERSAIGQDVYRVRLDGGGRERLSAASGTHAAQFNDAFSLYLDTWSDVTTPPQVRLHREDGAEVRVVDENPVPALATFRLAPPEFLQVPARDGFVLEAMLLRPPGFDPSRRYPVYQHTYGGPRSPSVKNAWGNTTYLFHQLLAQRGVVVWICDNRSASSKGAVSAWPSYRRFGEGELRDVEDGLDWLRGQPWVDASRIGIHGWSFGGFMVAYALTHSRSFAMGIAGGAVTDWRDYDSIYTERYMGHPRDNAEGYLRSAPREAAALLHGRLLLVHSAMDDNVHPRHATRFAGALQKAGRTFRMMLYPQARHTIVDPAQLEHLHALKLEFVEETLLGRTAASTGVPASSGAGDLAGAPAEVGR
ncbi:MAG TPA: S9 family peptidase [Vicinamibacteria bacterium]|nr:S9 family peptidase [Vicinamibacteria bacterium]